MGQSPDFDLDPHPMSTFVNNECRLNPGPLVPYLLSATKKELQDIALGRRHACNGEVCHGAVS